RSAWSNFLLSANAASIATRTCSTTGTCPTMWLREVGDTSLISFAWSDIACRSWTSPLSAVLATFANSLLFFHVGKLLLSHNASCPPAGRGKQVAGPGVRDQPVCGGFIGAAEVDAILVQPVTHGTLAHEVQVQPVVAQPACVALTVVIAGFVPARLPVK